MSNAPDYSLNEQIYQNSDKTIRIYKVNIFLFCHRHFDKSPVAQNSISIKK